MPELEARHPRLRDDQPGRPDAELVADVDRILEQTRRRQVLAEDPRRQLATELLPPGPVMLARIGVDGLVPPAVDGEVGLSVAVDVQAAHGQPRRDRALEDARQDLPPLPFDLARHSDVDRHHMHWAPSTHNSGARSPVSLDWFTGPPSAGCGGRPASPCFRRSPCCTIAGRARACDPRTEAYRSNPRRPSHIQNLRCR